MRYRVEREEQGNNWLVVTTASDGIVDVLAEFTTRTQALRECKAWNEEYARADSDERHYSAQYDHACGYHN